MLDPCPRINLAVQRILPLLDFCQLQIRGRGIQRVTFRFQPRSV